MVDASPPGKRNLKQTVASGKKMRGEPLDSPPIVYLSRDEPTFSSSLLLSSSVQLSSLLFSLRPLLDTPFLPAVAGLRKLLGGFIGGVENHHSRCVWSIHYR
jgi:hypothetical protein